MGAPPSFGRENELAVWLLLALWVRKMELLSARWDDMDLEAGIWTLARENTKTNSSLRIPLAKPVIAWLDEAMGTISACRTKSRCPDWLCPAELPYWLAC